MSDAPPRGWRDSAFLIAAIAVPVVVVALFLVASAIPRWTVAPPGYDLVLRSDAGYNPASPQLLTTIRVRDGRVVAEIQPAVPNSYPSKPSVFVFDHLTSIATEVPLDLPTTLNEGETLRVVAIEALASRRVVDTAMAPDGYAFDVRYRRGPGIMGELFGMGRYDGGASVVKDGRVVRITIGTPFGYSLQPVGWLAAPEAR